MLRKVWLLFILLPTIVYGQGVEELEKRNGFKDIKLTSSVSAYEGLELKKDDVNIDETFPNSTLYTAKKGHYESIGKLKIYDLEVYAYKDSIYQINVVTEKDPNLYKGMKKLFGEPKYGYRSEVYYWSTDKLKLEYGSHSKNKIAMTYYSHLMVEKRKEEKKQVVENIADDF
ncbi:hypothetical protein E1176_17870 [Fulvivirga sp. RKSG066]|uniref:hypothetical protein n=1 Tax=Fulvivirga aurantia TaxID=2529383 RepID=UPI0012BCBE18|nr:hypothetical protein [Fulvivirga aurantia]MTI22905.1 hypothetical protein [Fulvivirga aurantia]